MWKAIGAISIADGLWLAADPKGWSKFWSRTAKKAGKRPSYHWAFAAMELGIGAWMLLPRASGKLLEAGGETAKRAPLSWLRQPWVPTAEA